MPSFASALRMRHAQPVTPPPGQTSLLAYEDGLFYRMTSDGNMAQLLDTSTGVQMLAEQAGFQSFGASMPPFIFPEGSLFFRTTDPQGGWPAVGGLVEVVRSGDHVVQKFTHTDSGREFARTSNDGSSWRAWRETPAPDHSHTISSIGGLNLALNAKANSSHTHLISHIDGLSDALSRASSTTEEITLTPISPFAGSIKLRRSGPWVTLSGGPSRASSFSANWTQFATIPAGWRPLDSTPFSGVEFNTNVRWTAAANTDGALSIRMSGATTTNGIPMNATWAIA